MSSSFFFQFLCTCSFILIQTVTEFSSTFCCMKLWRFGINNFIFFFFFLQPKTCTVLERRDFKCFSCVLCNSTFQFSLYFIGQFLLGNLYFTHFITHYRNTNSLYHFLCSTLCFTNHNLSCIFLTFLIK